MLCSGEKFSWEVDSGNASNAEIIEAFSPSDSLSLHCIINTAGREIFVLAATCRHAKIISVYHQHLQAVGCGRCSSHELKKFTEKAPDLFGKELEAALRSGQPSVLWPAGYVSDQLDRRAKDRIEKLILGTHP